MCRQMNNKQQNCLILSITHNTMKLKSWRLRTHTHAHTSTLDSINAFRTIHKMIHLHHFTLTNVFLCCAYSQRECEHHLPIWLLLISQYCAVSYNPKAFFSFWGEVMCHCALLLAQSWTSTVSVSVWLQQLCPFLTFYLCTLKNVSFSDTTNQQCCWIQMNACCHVIMDEIRRW